MQQLIVNLPDDVALLFNKACMSSEKIQQEVLQEMVIRYLEDLEDTQEALESLKQGGETSLGDLRKELGL